MTRLRHSPGFDLQLRLPIILTLGFIALLFVAGGASRADAIGQVVVRTGAWVALIATIMAGPRPLFADLRPVLWLLLAAIALPLLQLFPLPPDWWQALPGRSILIVPGEAQPWRPLTMTPGATGNALASLIVPAVMLALLAQFNDQTHQRLSAALLVLICGAVALALLQFSGTNFDNPMVNDVPDQVDSIFANRNHFALLVAIGCLLVPMWIFKAQSTLAWRGALGTGLILLFILTILATGSRSGMLLGATAITIAPLLVYGQLRRRLKYAPPWVAIMLVALGIVLIGLFVWLSVAAGRAESISRLVTLGAGDDMRTRALPTIMEMIRSYFPLGSGLGGFDAIFRIHEPITLLKFTYLNQAHNDYLGVALDAGLAGMVLIAAALIWWVFATVRVWRARANETVALARLGSAMLALIFLSSTTDYPARTPLIMAIVIIAAVWLARGSANHSRTALLKGG